MSKLGEVFVEVRGDADPLVSDVTGALSEIEGQAAGFGDRFEQAMTGRVAQGAAVVGAAAATGIAAGVTQAIGLDTQLREVVTLFGETGAAAEASVKGLQPPVKDLSVQLGIAQSEVTDGLYQAISAGVPRENVFEFLETAGKFAIGGVTDTETAVDGLTTAINAFGLDTTDADKVADAFFAAVQGGKTNAEELSASLFAVAPSASAAGLGLEETLAATAALTASGVPTSVATTQIRAAIEELNDPSREVAQVFEELTGKTFREFTAQGGTLEDALGIIGDAAEDSGMQIGELFGSVQASAAATTLYNDQSGAFASNLDLQADAAGAAADAYELVADGAKQQLEVLKQQGLALLTTLGQTFLPIVNSVVGFLVRMGEVFTGLPDPIQKFLAILTGAIAVLGPLPLIIGKMLPLFRSFGTVIGIATKAFALLSKALFANPFGLIVLAIAALVAAFVWAWNNIDGFREFFVNLWERIKEATAAVVEWFQNVAMPALAAVWDVVVAAATAAWEMIQAAVGAVVDWFTGTVWPILQAFGDQLSAAWSVLADVAATVWGAVRDAVTAVVDWFTGTAWPAIQTFGEGVAAAWETLRDAAATVWGAIQDAVAAVVDWFRDHVGPVIDAVGDLIGAVFGRVGDHGNTMSEVLSAVFGFIADGWQTFMDILRTVWDAVGQPLLDAVKAGFEIARDVLAAVWDAIVAAVQHAWELIVGIWNAVGEPLLEAIKTGFEIMRDFLGLVWDAIKTVVETTLAVIAGIIAAITAAIRGDWSAVWEAIRGIASTVWEAIKTLVTAGITFVQTTIVRVLGVIRSLWSGIWTAIRTTASTIWTAIRTLVRTAINAVLRIVRTVMTTIRNVWRTMWNTVRNLVRTAWTNIRNAVRTGANRMMTVITGLPRRIRSAVSNFGTLLLNAGRRLINGLIRGIRERISAIGDAISDAASTVTRFWPFSPAREGPLRSHPPEQAGANIIGLMAAGMRANIGQIAAEAEKAARAAIPADPTPLFSVDEARPVVDRRAVTPQQVEQAVAGRAAAGQMVVNQTIYTVDPQKAATASIRKLRDAAYLGGDLDEYTSPFDGRMAGARR